MSLEILSYDEFPWHEFYFDTNSKTGTFCLAGASRSGKSTLIEMIWRSYFTKHITVMFLDNPTANAYDWARKYPKRIVITRGFDVCSELVIDLARYIQASSPKFKWLFVMDDVLTIHNSRLVNELLMSLRNVGISTVLSIQDVKMLSVPQRNNCNNILCGYSNTPARRKVILDEIIGRGIFTEQQYAQLTRDHGWLCRNCVEDRDWFHLRLDLTKPKPDETPDEVATITVSSDDLAKSKANAGTISTVQTQQT
jgi:hypothetical protein